MKVVGRPAPDLDHVMQDGVCVLFDPALVDTDLPPSENGAVIRSDLSFTRGQIR